MKYRITFFEMPTVHLTDQKNNAITPLRVKDPKLTQIQLAGNLRQSLPTKKIDSVIKFVDMVLLDPTNKILADTLKYGDKTIRIWRYGASFERVEHIIKDSDIVCITANFTAYARIIKDFIQWAKGKNPKIEIIIGGTDATHRPEFYLKSGSDFVVLGEGEIILHNLIEAIVKQKNTDNVSGIAFIKHGNVIVNKKTDSDTPQLDKLAFPALDLIDSNAYSESSDGAFPDGVKTPIALIETSRGCNQRCSFCASCRTKGKYRYISSQRITQLLVHYKEHGINTLLITDDSILSRLDSPNGRQDVITLFQTMREMGFAWELFNGVEISRLFNKDKNPDQDLINALFSHEIHDNQLIGCYRAYLPLESVRNDTPLKISKFHFFKHDNQLLDFELEKKIIVEILKRHIPMIELGLIICTPDEDLPYMELTCQRALEVKTLIKDENEKSPHTATQICFHIFADILLPGTPDYEKNRNRQAFSYDDYPELVNFTTSVINGDNFSFNEMFVIREKVFEKINGKEVFEEFKKSGKYIYHYP